MKINKRGCYTIKTYQNDIYTWCPTEPSYDRLGGSIKKSFCNAIAGSNGEDWIVTYTYNVGSVNGVQKRYAYVSCDYVK